MKQQIAVCALLAGMLCLSACGKPESAKKAEGTVPSVTAVPVAAQPISNTGRDLRVTPSDSFPAPGEEQYGAISVVDSIFSLTLENLVNESDCIVEATVENVIFTQIDGEPWTQVDVRITSSKAGSLQVGDLISIYELGGCMPMETFIEQNEEEERFSELTAEQIEQTTFVQQADGQDFPKVGDAALYFLIEKGDACAAPEGSFERISGTYESQFTKTADGYDNHGLENPCQFREEALNQAISEKLATAEAKR